jgi:hypothetical protein
VHRRQSSVPSKERNSHFSISRFSSRREFVLRSAAAHKAEGRAEKEGIAQNSCKAEKNVEAREVSGERAGDFHNLINTCVENFTEQKYLFKYSARLLLRAATPLF